MPSENERQATPIRFTPDELARVRERAAAKKLSLQAYLHDLVMNDVNEVQLRLLTTAVEVVERDGAAFTAAFADQRAERAEARADEREADRALQSLGAAGDQAHAA